MVVGGFEDRKCRVDWTLAIGALGDAEGAGLAGGREGLRPLWPRARAFAPHVPWTRVLTRNTKTSGISSPKGHNSCGHFGSSSA